MLIKDLQLKLVSLPGDSVFVQAIRQGAKDDFESCIKMIISQTFDNRKLVEKMIGTDLLTEILNYEQGLNL